MHYGASNAISLLQCHISSKIIRSKYIVLIFFSKNEKTKKKYFSKAQKKVFFLHLLLFLIKAKKRKIDYINSRVPNKRVGLNKCVGRETSRNLLGIEIKCRR